MFGPIALLAGIAALTFLVWQIHKGNQRIKHIRVDHRNDEQRRWNEQLDQIILSDAFKAFEADIQRKGDQ